MMAVVVPVIVVVTPNVSVFMLVPNVIRRTCDVPAQAFVLFVQA
jgi:hypothetical protein